LTNVRNDCITDTRMAESREETYTIPIH